jgi:hypothetical protein
MNERIKELWEKSFTNVEPGYDYERFAMLIVKECLGIVEANLDVNKVKAETDNEGRIWVNAQLTFSELIKRHFGVE